MSIFSRITGAVSSAWSSVNNLGVGNAQDPLATYYEPKEGALGAKVVKRDAFIYDASKTAQWPIQYQCVDGKVKVACGFDIKLDTSTRICPVDLPDVKPPELPSVPGLCADEPNNFPGQVQYYPYPDDLPSDADCAYVPFVARATPQFMQDSVCKDFPNATTGICGAPGQCTWDDGHLAHEAQFALVGSVVTMGIFSLSALAVYAWKKCCKKDSDVVYIPSYGVSGEEISLVRTNP